MTYDSLARSRLGLDQQVMLPPRLGRHLLPNHIRLHLPLSILGSIFLRHGRALRLAARQLGHECQNPFLDFAHCRKLKRLDRKSLKDILVDSAF